MKRIRLLLSLSFKTSIVYNIILCLSSIISAIQIFFEIYFTARFVELIMTGNINRKVIWYAGLIIFIRAVFYLINSYIELKLEVEKQYVNDQMNKILSKKIMDIQYEKIENPYYLDLRQKALYSIEVQDALGTLFLTIPSIVKKGVILAELFFFVFFLSKILVVYIMICNLLIAGVYIWFKKYEKEFFDKFASVSRKFSYYLGLCFDDKLQKDIRLYHMDEMLTNKIRIENKKMTEKKYHYYKNKGKLNGILNLFHVIQIAISYIYVIFSIFEKTSKRNLDYGQFTFYISATVRLFQTMRELMFDFVTLTQAFLYLQPYIEFMELEKGEEIEEKKEDKQEIESIEFQNVHFTYPGSKSPILSDISFRVHKNEKISIVGLNGAGKTTLIKLICRFYRPTKGRILINGMDIWEYGQEDYQTRVTTIFQDFKIFGVSILENITCQENGNYEKGLAWLEKLDMEYLHTKYERGLDTELNKPYEDEGIDLSGGEKQKIAVARALYKGGYFFILDEPTSALDPRAEHDIYSKFEELIGNKITFFISHRMTSSMLSDKVLVIENGKIAGFKSHLEWMENKDSLYYQLFIAQAKYYIK